MGRFFHGDTFQPCGVVDCPLNSDYNCCDCNIYNGVYPNIKCNDKGVDFNE
jgi:hypothetical protein